ncbi:succinate dehydrogenase assembly factor 2 [Notoacmeibacter marinus]|uniref:FAD assembly factor SdhE n=1 Tax=Notoacmeibacter marinus TaxID=1876515 RepID=A0A231UT25_9HYPH|nr:succinate dehydrogenase assembly factor 2 [Notoacmeibacter marinus]OXS99087.1 succinate dehydrogenase assembly factor 2 [Notoacmeibacter marinus]
MSGTKISSASIDDPRRKKLLFRAWHRGMREMDLILGPFADERIADLDDERLDQFEALMSENDQDLYRWVMGERAIPPQWGGPLLASIIAHRRQRIG